MLKNSPNSPFQCCCVIEALIIGFNKKCERFNQKFIHFYSYKHKLHTHAINEYIRANNNVLWHATNNEFIYRHVLFLSNTVQYSVRYTLFYGGYYYDCMWLLIEILAANNNNDNKFIDSTEHCVCVWHVCILHVWVSAFGGTYIQLFVMMCW